MSDELLTTTDTELLVEQTNSLEVLDTTTPSEILEVALQGPAGPQGDKGEPGTSSTTWDYYATNWTTPPAQVGTTAAGAVYSYTLSGTTRYRLVPSPYVAAQDAFYSAWDGVALSGLVVSRGS